MATPTYTALATITLSSSASSVTFSSIPSTYRDLVLIVRGTLSGSANANLNFNGSSADLSQVQMYGTGSSYGSLTGSTGRFTDWSGESMAIAQIFDYSASDKHTTYLARSSSPGYEVDAFAGRWAQTTVVTQVAAVTSGTFSSGTTLSLYGIEA